MLIQKHKILLAFLGISMLSVLSSADPIFRINSGSNLSINKFSNCKNINNASAKDVMVPTNTSTEWSQFLANLPGSVTATTCCLCPDASYAVIGTACSGGAWCTGSYNGSNYMITPSGCTDSATPTCAGGADAVTKTWGTDGIATGIVNADNGAANTTSLAVYGDAYAAKFCENMTYGGYTDWFLPGSNEVAHLVVNKTALKLVGSYWDSDEMDSGHAYAKRYSGSIPDGTKPLSLLIRCMRKF